MFHWTGTGCFESSYIGTQKHVIFDPKGLELLKTMIMSRTLCYIERLLAPYEVVERSCAIFYILMYFTRYKTNKCVSNFFDGTNFQIGVADPWKVAEKHHFKHLLLYSYTR